MKRLLIILGLGLTIGMANVNTSAAQIVNVYVNIDLQPAWGPAGYDYVAFYYFPTLNIYYDVQNALFYYLSGRRWVYSYYLPIRYQGYDLYTLYKVVINDIHNPWIYYRTHRSLYAHYRNVRTQTPIRFMTNDYRYQIARTNTRAWIEPRRIENRQSGNNNISRSNPQPRNNNVAPRQSNTPRSQMAPRNNQNTTVAPRQNTPPANVNRNPSTSRNNPNTTVAPRQNTPPANVNRTPNTSRNNQSTTVAPRQNRAESSNQATVRSGSNENRNNSNSSTRSSANTGSSRSERSNRGSR